MGRRLRPDDLPGLETKPGRVFLREMHISQIDLCPDLAIKLAHLLIEAAAVAEGERQFQIELARREGTMGGAVYK
jgi:hypothetical protein